MITTVPELELSAMDIALNTEFGEGVYDNTFNLLSYRLQNSGYAITEYPFFKAIQDEYRSLLDQADMAEDENYQEELDDIYARIRELFSEMEDGPSDHGVCDDVSQIHAQYPQLMDDSRRFIIGITVINAEQVPDWRWHKWGRYIGEHTPQHECIGDEEDIDQVLCFSIIEILGHNPER